MKRLKVIRLYQSEESNQNEFMKSINSSLNVKTNYQKVTEDLEWIDLMELTIPYIGNILKNPNRFIINEEEIVKIELARRITVDSIKHLSKNTNFIQDFDQKTGDVKPSKILNINKEESYDTYENRFIYTLIQNMKFFISKRKKILEGRKAIKERSHKQIDYTGISKIANENISIKIELTTNKEEKCTISDTIARIERLEQQIQDLTSSETYKIIDKKHIALVVSPIKRTNVILKNVNFQYAVKLWNYMQQNIDDKTKEVKSRRNFSDDKEMKELVDETFLLDYLIVNSLDKGQADTLEKKQAKQQITNKVLEKILYSNDNLTEEQLKDIISKTYKTMKHKNMATIAEVQRVFKEHIDYYLKQIK